MNLFEEAKYIHKLNSQHCLKEAAGFPKYYLALNHFEPDDLFTIKIRNERELHKLENLEDWFIEDITDEHGFYLVDHDDEDINFIKLPASNEQELRKIMKKELKQQAEADPDFFESEDTEIDSVGYIMMDFDSYPEDTDEAINQIVDYWFEWVDASYVDKDSASKYELANMDEWKKDAWSYSELWGRKL